MSTDLLIRTVVALVLAVAFAGMVSRAIWPPIKAWWLRQTTAAAAQVRALQTLPLPAHGRHTRRHFKAVS